MTRYMLSRHITLKRELGSKGFILPFTMLIVTLVLLVVTTGSNTLAKQLFFSKIYRQSQAAYYAADDAVSCAIAIDDGYIGVDGYGIFPGGTSEEPSSYIENVLINVNSYRLGAGLLEIDLEEIKCAQVAIFDPLVSDFEVSSTDYQHNGPSGLETGKTSEFTMKMPVGDDTFHCAKITINKTPTFRQIIGQGYSSCGGGVDTVERAVVNTTITE